MSRGKLVLPLFILFGLGLLWQLGTEDKTPKPLLRLNNHSSLNPNWKQRPSHRLVFYDERSFGEGLSWAKKVKKTSQYKIVGGITPHHLAVGFILADFYSRLSRQKPKTIILLGPNHYERGNFKVLTSLEGWQTPFGLVAPEEMIINALLKKDLVRVDEDTLAGDHAVAGSMSFVKYYLPEATVVPLLLSGGVNEDESNILAKSLSDFVSAGVVIVAPVDFSHYLNNHQAQEKDKVTLQAMNDFDYRQLFLMNNDYLDSPPSVATLLMVMQKIGTTHFEMLYHANSGQLQKSDYTPTTSYFSIVFY